MPPLRRNIIVTVLAVPAFVALAWLFFWLNDPGPSTTKNMRNLSHIGMALFLYAENYGGFYPDKLQALVDQGLIGQDVIRCPYAPSGAPPSIATSRREPK